MLQRLSLTSLVIIGATALPSRRQAQGFGPLRFTPQGTFHISVFNDMHYGEAEDTTWGPLQDVDTTRVMNAVLSNETPQLVVLNGDLITGENTFLSNSTAYLDEIVAPLVQRNLTWASTYGNHDSNYNLAREGIFEREKSYPNSLTENMVAASSAGLTNYYLPVFSSDVTKVDPLLLLWFFDSRGGFEFQTLDASGNQIPIPEVVDTSVVEWFLATNQALSATYNNSVIPSLAFFHIPVNAMVAFQQQGVDAHKEPGINDDNPLAQQGYYTDPNGNAAYDGADIPFMAALLETPGLMATFSGHDHGDDWCFKWNSLLPGMNLTGNGLDLCFGRHTGYGGYGDWIRGGRQILLNEETLGAATQTWVRLEDGTVSGSVTLNSTYGADGYAVVADRYTYE